MCGAGHCQGSRCSKTVKGNDESAHPKTGPAEAGAASMKDGEKRKGKAKAKQKGKSACSAKEEVEDIASRKQWEMGENLGKLHTIVLDHLNQAGFYLFGVEGEGAGKLEYCKVNKPPSERKRNDVLGFLLVLNYMEVSFAGAILLDRNIYDWLTVGLFMAKLFSLSIVSFFYLRPALRKSEIGSTILIIFSGLSTLSLFWLKGTDLNWILSGCCLVITMSLCLLPSYGRVSLASTLAVCWSFITAFVLSGWIIFHRSPAEIIAYTVVLVFFSNIVCACKHVLFLNKEEIAALFANQRNGPLDIPIPRLSRAESGHESHINGVGFASSANSSQVIDPAFDKPLDMLQSLRRNAEVKDMQDSLDVVIADLEKLRILSSYYNGVQRSSLHRKASFYNPDQTENVSDWSQKPTSLTSHRRSWQVPAGDVPRSLGSTLVSLGFPMKASLKEERRQTSDLGPCRSKQLMLPEMEEVGSIRQCSDLGMPTTQAATASLEAPEMTSLSPSGKTRRRRKESYRANSSKSHRPSCSSSLSGSSITFTSSVLPNAANGVRGSDSSMSSSRKPSKRSTSKHKRGGSVDSNGSSNLVGYEKELGDLEVTEENSSQGEEQVETTPSDNQSELPNSNEIQERKHEDPGQQGIEKALRLLGKQFDKEEDSADEDLIGKPVFYTGLRLGHHDLAIDLYDDGEGVGKQRDDSDFYPGSERTHSCSESSLPQSIVPSVVLEADSFQLGYLRKQMVDWNFGPGGIFERLEDDNMPASFQTCPLTTLFTEAVRHFDCAEPLNIDLERMVSCMVCIEGKYMSPEVVQYHNNIHATDVLQSMICFLNIEDIRLSLIDPSLSVFAALFSAAIHDVAHPGRNQAFHIRTQSHLSILYSDRSVLERHHLAVAFSTMRANPDLNFLDALDGTEASIFREKVITAVLSTDMATHGENLTHFKALYDSPRPLCRAKNRASCVVASSTKIDDELHKIYESDTNTVICLLLHLGDIANVSKDWDVYKQWIPRIFGEFFAQGDEERSLGFVVSRPYDRDTCCPCAMQEDFISWFVTDTVEAVLPWCPMIGTLITKNLTENKVHLQTNAQVKISDMW